MPGTLRPEPASSTKGSKLAPALDCLMAPAMVRPYLPLNALRAFEASARHLSFTRAAIELWRHPGGGQPSGEGAGGAAWGAAVPPPAARARALTDEGLALLPALADELRSPWPSWSRVSRAAWRCRCCRSPRSPDDVERGTNLATIGQPIQLVWRPERLFPPVIWQADAPQLAFVHIP